MKTVSSKILDFQTSKTPLVTPSQSADPIKIISEFTMGIERGKKYSFKQLLYFQIQAQRAHLQVESVTKVADAISSTLRKLQQTQ